MQIPNSDKPISIYSLDMIISVGYRVNSRQGVAFRRWATRILKEYMHRGLCTIIKLGFTPEEILKRI